MKFNGNLKLSALLLIVGLIGTSLFEAQFEQPNEVSNKTLPSISNVKLEVVSPKTISIDKEPTPKHAEKPREKSIEKVDVIPVVKSTPKGKLNLSDTKLTI